MTLISSIICLICSIVGSSLSIYFNNIHYNVVNIIAAVIFIIVILIKKNKANCPLAAIPISIALIKDIYYWTVTSASSLKYMATSIMISDMARLITSVAIILIWWLYIVRFIENRKVLEYTEYGLIIIKVILYVLPIIFYNNQCTAEYYMNMISYFGIFAATILTIRNKE